MFIIEASGLFVIVMLAGFDSRFEVKTGVGNDSHLSGEAKGDDVDLRVDFIVAAVLVLFDMFIIL